MAETYRTYSSSLMTKRRAGSDPENDLPEPITKPVFAPYPVVDESSVATRPVKKLKQPDPADQLKPLADKDDAHNIESPDYVGPDLSSKPKTGTPT